MIERLAKRWVVVAFPAVPLERVAVFRIAVTVFALIDIVFVSDYIRGYTTVDPMFFDPVYLLRIGEHPVPSPAA